MQVELLAITKEAERLIEEAARTCYASLNKRRKDNKVDEEFIKRLIRRGHLSVIEHASATFKISGISRVATHQLIRHRLCSYSQRSQRYVAEENSNFIIPHTIRNHKEAYKLFEEKTKELQAAYIKLIKYGIPKEDARYILPQAIQTEIIISANFRELRHIFSLRGRKDAQQEIREIVIEMLKIVKKYAPNIFFDFIINEEEKIIEIQAG